MTPRPPFCPSEGAPRPKNLLSGSQAPAWEPTLRQSSSFAGLIDDNIFLLHNAAQAGAWVKFAFPSGAWEREQNQWQPWPASSGAGRVHRSSAATGRPITDHRLLTTGYFPCTATAAVPHRIILKIKRLAAKTPPLLSGAPAAQFAVKNFRAARRIRRGVSPVPCSPSKMALNDSK